MWDHNEYRIISGKGKCCGVQKMNNIRNAAMEVVSNDLISA